MKATCGHCRWQHTGPDAGAQAVAHEADNAGHRVTVWDSPTSQLPRALWRTVQIGG